MQIVKKVCSTNSLNISFHTNLAHEIRKWKRKFLMESCYWTQTNRSRTKEKKNNVKNRFIELSRCTFLFWDRSKRTLETFRVSWKHTLIRVKLLMKIRSLFCENTDDNGMRLFMKIVSTIEWFDGSFKDFKMVHMNNFDGYLYKFRLSGLQGQSEFGTLPLPRVQVNQSKISLWKIRESSDFGVKWFYSVPNKKGKGGVIPLKSLSNFRNQTN